MKKLRQSIAISILLLMFPLGMSAQAQSPNNITPIAEVIARGEYDEDFVVRGEIIEVLRNNHYVLQDATGELVIDGGGSRRDAPLNLELGETVIVFGEFDFEKGGVGLDVFTVQREDGTLLTTRLYEREYGGGNRGEGSPQNRGGGSPVNLQQAVTIALSLYPEAEVIEVERTRERGRVLFDVKLDNGLAVYVDSQSGEVIEVEPHDDNGRGRDDDDDRYDDDDDDRYDD